jgi:hypothetical protein
LDFIEESGSGAGSDEINCNFKDFSGASVREYSWTGTGSDTDNSQRNERPAAGTGSGKRRVRGYFIPNVIEVRKRA